MPFEHRVLKKLNGCAHLCGTDVVWQGVQQNMLANTLRGKWEGRKIQGATGQRKVGGF